jgi:hypothetical protein
MAISIKTLITPKAAENIQTTQYVVPAGAVVIIDKFTATNTSSGNVEFSVNLVENGSVVANDNLIVDARVLAPGETYTFPQLCGQVIESQAFISTLASAGSALTIRASGREIT